MNFGMIDPHATGALGLFFGALNDERFSKFAKLLKDLFDFGFKR